MEKLDSPERGENIRRIILKKTTLKRFYDDVYSEYLSCLQQCSKEGAVVELGSGVGFAKTVIPCLIASDILPYQGLDLIIDGTSLPFKDKSLRMICMMNVFHHIPNVRSFLLEAERCLVHGGRILIFDQHVGILSKWILAYLHHEPFNQKVENWQFVPKGPLSDANGALAWIVFIRDRMVFDQLYPELNLIRYEPAFPTRYWLTGGLKKWNLLPSFGHNAANYIDNLLMKLSPSFGSFVFIEIEKVQK